MSTLSEIIDRVETDLQDTTNAIWSEAELARAVRWALEQLSWVTPRRASAVLIAQEGVREYALNAHGLGGILFITEVWHPYDAAESGQPARPLPWRLLDDDTLQIDTGTIYAGDGIRILYAQVHTIQGLDGASATTLSLEQEELVCLGAGGYAALQRALGAIGQINVHAEAPQLWREWGQQRLAEFHTRLACFATRDHQRHTVWTAGWPLE
jgi:hypothetical protein